MDLLTKGLGVKNIHEQLTKINLTKLFNALS